MPNKSLSSRAVSITNWRTTLQWISVIVAIEIALHSFIVKEPILTMVGAGLWLGGFLWTRRGAIGGAILIGAPATWEILATLFFSEEFAEGTNVPAWILSVHLVSVAVALVTVVMTIVSERTASRRPGNIQIDILTKRRPIEPSKRREMKTSQSEAPHSFNMEGYEGTSMSYTAIHQGLDK